MKLGVFFKNGKAKDPKPFERQGWTFSDDDYLLYALLTDPIYCAELLGEDPGNLEYAGMYKVRDYQYPLFRLQDEGLYVGAACARSVGKTESVKWRSIVHIFRRIGENLLITAPELIHLLPLTDAIESLIQKLRITREFLDKTGQKTGLTHRPFGARFVDGTEIVGRIPRLTGTGVKGQHQPDLIIDEAQDYPEKGWTEVHETVLKDHKNEQGDPDFTYHFYGVHSGVRDTGFHKRTTKGFKVLTVTALRRPSWNKAEKEAAIASYGGTANADYRRNILGEAGGAASPFFVTARVVACMDQDRESHYNTAEYVAQKIRVEELDASHMSIGEFMDIPSPGAYKKLWAGMDVGLTESPTVITLWAEDKVNRVTRLRLIRRYTLERMRTGQIREATFTLGWGLGTALCGFGMDATGMGLPMWQDMEDDENCPPHLWRPTPDGGSAGVLHGYMFNVKVPIAVASSDVTEDGRGNLRDQFGSAVRKEVNPETNQERYVTLMPMVEASTRYLRGYVDSTFLQLPFDPEVTSDMLAETQQRVKRISGLKSKPNAFHILDSMRAMAMDREREAVEEQMEWEEQESVYDLAL